MGKKFKVFILSEVLFGSLISYLLISCLNTVAIIKETGNLKFSIQNLNIFPYLLTNYSNDLLHKVLIFGNVIVLFVSIYYGFLYESRGRILKVGEIRVTDQISIPAASGNGQFGNAHFMTLKEMDKVKEIDCFYYSPARPKVPDKGGVVIGIRAMGALPEKERKEKIMYIEEDRHVLMVGSTRSGKTRRSILESMWLTMLAGENILVTDPKGELWAYTSPFAEELGYQMVVIDFREPNKGNHHTYMSDIVEAIDKEDIAEAIDLTWDLVSVLVGEAKGETIWHNGECAAIAAVILIVAMEAPKEYRNLTNVYYFLFNMAKPGEYGEMPITRYLESLEETHPARAVFAMAEIAHTRTRGSFFSSALGTLRHFTNPKIAEMTSYTDYSFEEMVNKKTIVYIILPDEKTTLYSLGSMYIMQHYIYNVKAAQKNGGRCPIDWHYFLDEFGNLPYIPPIPQFLSVGAGRGLLFLLAVQDFQQIEKKYKDDYKTIKNNCDAWIYLKCALGETQKEFSDRCGPYTVQVNSTNFSKEKGSVNNSSSLTGRPLLLPAEVGKIEEPYSLICMAGKDPIMLVSPDLSFYHANEAFGMGDKEHNTELVMRRNQEREGRRIPQINLWGIWTEYQVMEEYPEMGEMEFNPTGESISFLD